MGSIGQSQEILQKSSPLSGKYIKTSRRHFHQLLVRGDNIVSIWKVEAEQMEKTT
jgi:small nuclear ribonucleoprotein (snRNP)-like protein